MHSLIASVVDGFVKVWLRTVLEVVERIVLCTSELRRGR